MARDITVIIMACLLRCRRTGQAPERPRHIRGPLPLLRSRPGGVCSLAIARRPEPDKIADYRFAIADEEPVFALQIGNWQSEIEKLMAERVGFEPTEPLRVQRFSRPPESPTLAPLRMLLGVTSVAKKRL